MSYGVNTPDPYIAEGMDPDTIKTEVHDVYDWLVNPEDVGDVETHGFDADEQERKWQELRELFYQLKKEAPDYDRVLGLFIGYIRGNDIGIAVVYPNDSKEEPHHVAKETSRKNLTSVKESRSKLGAEYIATGYIVPDTS
ncbi:hypothetical protein [Halorubrum tebenquichense]|uniref:hypothetical protein n=1 Tax=Halorubrum tebenquichense TaxID=119434 RepID=UPI001267F4B5|nr:hypothetical protein [Halorubrum tebenquichense]